MALTAKQEKFCLFFHECGNASEAYRHAYSVKNMKSETVNRKAKELLDNGKITARLHELMAPALERAEVTAERIISELANIAFGDLRDVVEWSETGGVKLKNSDTLTPEQAAAISEVAETTTKDGGSKRIKRHDKVKALELLMRHKGMLNDKLNINGELNVSALEKGRERAKKRI